MNNSQLATSRQIEVMQAFVDGKVIQHRELGYAGWFDVKSPMWNWANGEYRVKPNWKFLLVSSDGNQALFEDRPPVKIGRHSF